MNKKFSLVSTVFNEKKRINATIDDLKNQTLQPDEIIITDAGSTDGTYEALQEWQRQSKVPIILLQEKGCNVARGRNLAIRKASYDLIASTDFGCRFHSRWLESLLAPFADPKVKAVGGAFTVIEEDLQTLSAKAGYLLFDGYKDNVHEPWFTPTSRSIAYYKEVFDAVGGYCEWLTLAADDTIFGRLAKKKGYNFHITNDRFVFWGRHNTALAYAKEAFRYGLGDGESGINKRSTVSNLIELIFRYTLLISLLIIGLLVFAKILTPGWLLLTLLCLPGLRSYIRYTKSWLRLRSTKYNFIVFVYGFYMLEITRIYYLKGFFKGYFKSPSYRKKAAKELAKQFAI